MSTVRKVISNTGYLFLDSAVITILGYLFWVILGKMLVPESMGAYSTIMNISLLITSFTAAGFARTGIKLISEYSTKNQKKHVSGFIRWSFKWSTVLNVIVGVLLVVYMFFIPFFNYLTVPIVTGIILYIAVNIYYILTSNYLVGLQNIKLLFKTNLISYILKVILAIVFIYFGFDYYGALGAFLVSAVIAVLLRVKKIPFSPGKIDKDRLKKYWKSSTILDMSMLAMNSANVFILSLFTDFYSVGIFTFAFMFSAAIRMIPTAIATSILPTGSSQIALNKFHNLKMIISRAIKYSFVILLPIITFLYIFSEKLIILFSSTSYIESAFTMQILLLGAIFIGFSIIISFALYSIGNLKDSRNILLLGAVINILMTLWLAKEYSFIGAATSFSVSSFIMFLLSWYYLKNKLKINFPCGQFTKVFFSAVLCGLIVFFLFGYAPRTVYIPLFAIVYFGVYSIMIRMFSIFDKRDKEFVLELEDKVPKKLLKHFRKFIDFYFK